MREYLTYLMIFFLPILVIGSIGTGIAWYLGYAMPLRHIVDIQQSDPRVVYRAETRDNIFHHKLLSINARQSAIMILGSSRVRAFTDVLTQNTDNFYNMSIRGMKLSETPWILQHINRDAMPEIIIWNIDPFQLNNNINKCTKEDFTLPALSSDFEQIIVGTRDLWQDVLLGNVNLGKLFHNIYLPNSVNTRLGSQALTDLNAGYPATGYLLRENVNLESIKNVRTNYREDLATRSKIYRSGTELCIPTTERLEQFLQLSEEYGVTTIGVVLPYAPDVYDAFMSESDFAYFPKAISKFEQIFAQQDVRFYNFSDPSIFDVDYTYFRDGHHNGPVLSAKVFYAIAQANPELFASYVDLDDLDQLIASARHPLALSKDVKIIDDPAKITEQVDLANQLIDAHEPNQAITLLTKILELNSSDIKVLITRARAYIASTQLEKAQYDVDLAINLNPNNSGAYRLRARIYYLQGDIESSIAGYNHALELNPMSFDNYAQLGLLYLESGDIPNAISRLETYIKKIGDNPAPQYVKALENARQITNQNQ
jgi:tetratricopeptide (TPR) repeat protein